MTTGRASEFGLTAAAGGVDCPARATRLRAISWIDEAEVSAALIELVTQRRLEAVPALAQDCSVETRLGPYVHARFRDRALGRPRHAGDLELLQHHLAEAIG